MLKFSQESGWMHFSTTTSVPYEEDSIDINLKIFQWPTWAIEMVNNGSRIQEVSKLLENERKEWQLQL